MSLLRLMTFPGPRSRPAERYFARMGFGYVLHGRRDDGYFEPPGRTVSGGDLDKLLRDGHELASHTFSHVSCRSISVESSGVMSKKAEGNWKR